MRRWLLSYTSLLVSCNQCLGKQKQPATGTVDSQLDMQLIGLLSVDIDLSESVDINQCEMQIKLEPEMNLNKHQTNQENSNNYYSNYQLNNDQQSDLKPNLNQPTNLLNSQSNAQKLYQFDSNLVQNKFEINSIDQLINSKIAHFNDSQMNQAQLLVSTDSTVLNSKNNHSSIEDDLYKLSTSNRKFMNRIVLNFEKTNKCHATSQVSPLV